MPAIATSDVHEVLRTTGAVRTFTDDPVPDAMLVRLLDVARFAGSGGNRQPWRVVVIKDQQVRRALGDLYLASWREYAAQVEAGLVPFSPGEDMRWHGPPEEIDPASGPERPADLFAASLHAVPALVLVLVDVTKLAVVDNGLDRQSFVGGASIYPFVHNIMLAARSAGLGGVMTTLICRREPAVRELLGVPDPFAVASLVALGVPARSVRALRRRPVSDFASVDRFDGESLGHP